MWSRHELQHIQLILRIQNEYRYPLGLGHLRLGHLRLGHLRLGHLRLGHQIRTPQIRTPHISNSMTPEIDQDTFLYYVRTSYPLLQASIILVTVYVLC
jgi:hypothetical protein